MQCTHLFHYRLLSVRLPRQLQQDAILCQYVPDAEERLLTFGTQVESPIATVKTCMRPNMDVDELKETWDFEPKGVKLVL